MLAFLPAGLCVAIIHFDVRRHRPVWRIRARFLGMR
jgi:hypothetical protein